MPVHEVIEESAPSRRPRVLVELTRQRDAWSIDSRRLCHHRPFLPASDHAADEGHMSDDFRKGAQPVTPIGDTPHSHFFHRKKT
jgi:hypothetical protein